MPMAMDKYGNQAYVDRSFIDWFYQNNIHTYINLRFI